MTELRITGGVDTHKDSHVAAALDGQGRLLGSQQFPTTGRGYSDLLRGLEEFGEVDTVDVERTGSWGAGLTRSLRASGVTVIEVNRPNRQRRKGKSDTADAISAARAVQANEAVGVSKEADGPVESIRILRVARRTAIKARTQAINQIHSLIDTAPKEVRQILCELAPEAIIERASRFHRNDARTPTLAAKMSIGVLARRVLALNEELRELDGLLASLIGGTAPTLAAVHGVGPDEAGALLG